MRYLLEDVKVTRGLLLLLITPNILKFIFGVDNLIAIFNLLREIMK